MRAEVRLAAILAAVVAAAVASWGLRHRSGYLHEVEADAWRRGIHPDSVREPDRWPLEVYAPALKRARDPREAEAAVPDADSVRYSLIPQGPDTLVEQAFFVHTGRWPLAIVLLHDPARRFQAAPRTGDPSPGRYVAGREAALAWYRGRRARQRADLLAERDSLDRLVAALMEVRDTFWMQADSTWYFEGYFPFHEMRRFEDIAVRRLVACLDDPRPAAAVALGRPVARGAMCYHALARIGSLTWWEDGGRQPGGGWSGRVPPTAGEDELRAAKRVWETALARDAVRLR